MITMSPVKLRRGVCKPGKYKVIAGCVALFFVPQLSFSDVVIEEVYVTAQKRSERNVDVPITISSATGEELANAGITNTQDLAQTVPGLRVDLSGGFSQPSIRGIGSSVAGPGLSASVATYVDGIYRASALTSAFELSDIDSIQVLKGPQGTLFGRNATGGAIIVTTTQPSFEPDAEIKLSYGRYNTSRLQAKGSMGLTDRLAVGGALYQHQSDGFVENSFDGTNVDEIDNWGARVKALYDVNDKISLLLSYAHTDKDDGSSGAVNAYRGISVVNDPNNPAVDPVHQDGTAIDLPTERGRVSADGPSGMKATSDDIALRVEWDLGSMMLTSYTGYHEEEIVDQRDYDATSLPVFHGKYRVEGESISQELNLSSAGDSLLHWVAGVFYFRDDSQFPYFNSVNTGQAVTPAFRNGQKTEAWAVFWDGSYDFTDLLTITVGARYSEDTMTVNYEVPGLIPYTTAEETFEDFSPRVVLRYSVDENSSAYLSLTKGYKSGVFNPAGFTTTPVDPEELTAYEVGYKTQMGQWNANLAAFYYDYSELQVNRFVGASSVLVNAADATIFGLDAQFSYMLSSSLHMDLGLAYTKSEYDEFMNAPAYIGTGFPGDPYQTASVDASGNELLRTPELTANLSVNYGREVGSGMADFNISYYYSSSFYFDAANDVEQDAYSLMNLRASWAPFSERYGIAVYANNVLDEEYLVQVLPQSATLLQQYGLPRSYGIEFTMRF